MYSTDLEFGLICWGLTPQQQPGLYRGGDYDDDATSVSLVDETGVARETHPPTASNGRQFHTHGLCPVPVLNPGRRGVKPDDPRRHHERRSRH